MSESFVPKLPPRAPAKKSPFIIVRNLLIKHWQTVIVTLLLVVIVVFVMKFREF